MCNHATQSITEKDGAVIIYCLDCGKEIHAIKTCHFCGQSGDLVETEYYDKELNRDVKGWECNGYTACMDRCIDQRSLPSYYRKTAELKV